MPFFGNPFQQVFVGPQFLPVRGQRGARGRPPARPRQPRQPKPKKPKKEVIPAHIIEIPPPNFLMNFYDSNGDLTMNGVAVYLSGRFADGQEASEGDTDFQWTHVALMGRVHVDWDIRDNYPGAPNTEAAKFSPGIAEGEEPRFQIVFAERINRKTAWEGFRVYLDRLEPTWPNNDI